MTTNSMTCARFTGSLMGYLERETDELTRAAMDRHAATCASCGALLADLRRIERDAAALPELTPARDLWAGIADRIETPVVPIAPARGVPARQWSARRLMNTGLLAASLVGAVALGYLARGAPARVAEAPRVVPATDTPRSQPPRQVAQAPVPVPVADAPPSSGGGVAEAPRRDGTTRTAPATPVSPPVSRAPGMQLAAATLTADYDREIAALRVVLGQRRVQLDSTTLAVIERNLAVIDSAIADSRRAIAADPSSPYLIELLNHSLQTKVELMRTAALLPSRT